MLFSLLFAEVISPKAIKFYELILKTNLKVLNVVLKIVVKGDSFQ